MSKHLKIFLNSQAERSNDVIAQKSFTRTHHHNIEPTMFIHTEYLLGHKTILPCSVGIYISNSLMMCVVSANQVLQDTWKYQYSLPMVALFHDDIPFTIHVNYCKTIPNSSTKCDDPYWKGRC